MKLSFSSMLLKWIIQLRRPWATAVLLFYSKVCRFMALSWNVTMPLNRKSVDVISTTVSTVFKIILSILEIFQVKMVGFGPGFDCTWHVVFRQKNHKWMDLRIVNLGKVWTTAGNLFIVWFLGALWQRATGGIIRRQSGKVSHISVEKFYTGHQSTQCT